MKKCNNKKTIIAKNTVSNSLNEREQLFLKLIVDEYIDTATPIGSNFLLQSNKDLNYSSATVRSVMANLEKKGYLIKNHTSSGRVPSTLGFKFYEENLAKYNVPTQLKNQLQEIFQKRNQNIDDVINDSVSLISNIIQLPTIITTIHLSNVIKKIELVKLNNTSALLIIIFDDGNLVKNEIKFDKTDLIDDIVICVKILNDRLIDLSLEEINEQIEIISQLVKAKVHNYEFVMQQIITRIFDKNLIKHQAKAIAINNVLKQKEFNETKKLTEVLSLLDNTSIWEQLALQTSDDHSAKITFGKELNANRYENIAIASTNIKVNNSKKQISVIGPTRMKYGEVIALLNFIKKEIENNE